MASYPTFIKPEIFSGVLKILHTTMRFYSTDEMENLHHLNFAEGWIALGDYASALEELNKLSPKNKASIPAMNLHLRALMKAKKWSCAEVLARSLVESAPFLPMYSIFLEALHQQGRNLEAYETLSSRLYLDSLEVAYHAACYACQVGEMKSSKRCLDRAIEIGKILHTDVRHKALEEPLLEKLWMSFHEVD